MKKTILCLLLILSLLFTGCTIVIVPEETQAPAAAVSGSGLTVHFVDVGQADCALLECDGNYMIIDGGNKDDGQLVVSYLQQQGVEELAAVVCTHAHEDHVGGLPSVLAVYPTAAIYAPTRTYSSRIFDDFLYYADQQRQPIQLPQPGDTFSLGQTQITVLGPVESYADPNDTSIILRADYGETSFLFTGDMEVAAENDMMDHWEQSGKGDIFDVDVLKVGHHCSETSTGYRFLNAVMPEYGVISVGTDNSYGHPHAEPLSRLQQAGVTLLRTDELGTIVAASDGQQITFTWSDTSAVPSDVEPAEPICYIGNKNSKTFHAPDCANLPSEKNRVEFDTFNAARDAGYKPCGSCLG